MRGPLEGATTSELDPVSRSLIAVVRSALVLLQDARWHLLLDRPEEVPLALVLECVQGGRCLRSPAGGLGVHAL